MALRFVDDRGTEWEVWEVGAYRPLADAPLPRRARSQSGFGGRGPGSWLCFESATQRRRLERYPEWWHALSPRDLAALCSAARPEPPRVVLVARPRTADAP
jgi:hypothetical protein